jgi:hypothetical protein
LPDVPTVFNRIDFIGILSPGYVAAFLWILIFDSKLLVGNQTLSYEVISAVIFVIAGPALGLTLSRIHHGITSFLHHYQVLFKKPPKDSWLAKSYKDSSLEKLYTNSWLEKRAKQALKEREEYARVRLELKGDERLELDVPEAYTNFEASVGVALIGLGVYGVLMPLLMNTPMLHWYVFFALFAGGCLFFVGAWLNYKVYWQPVYNRLKKSLPHKQKATAKRQSHASNKTEKNKKVTFLPDQR